MMEGDAGRFLGATIFYVANDGVANVGKLGADLVIAPRLEINFHEGGVGSGFTDGVGKKGLFAAWREVGAMGAMGEGVFEGTGWGFEVSFDFCKVNFLNVFFAHLAVES